jgi:light-regulated signal transduction histidine kinase (bacteriophytochrome)
LVIEDQKEELAAMNEELLQSNESLQGLNNKISGWNETLEETVTKRTQKIETQNNRLKEYAFYNAHKLRGPFCRIKGLIMLLEIVNDEHEKENIERLVEESVKELESVIQEIQEIVKEVPDDDLNEKLVS